MVWDDYTKYRIGGVNPLQGTYTGVGVNELEDIENRVRLEKSAAHSRMSRQSYGATEEIEKDEFDNNIEFFITCLGNLQALNTLGEALTNAIMDSKPVEKKSNGVKTKKK